MNLRALLAMLACLLALAAPVSAHMPASRLPVLPPPAAQFCMELRDIDDSAPRTLHLDGLHDRAGPCRRVLVRQNPWSHFDPDGLYIGESVVNGVGRGAGYVIDTVANVVISIATAGNPTNADIMSPVNRFIVNYNGGDTYSQGWRTSLSGPAFDVAAAGTLKPNSPLVRLPEQAPLRGSGRIGDVGTMGELKAPGAGTGLERHEIPSRAAQEAAFIEKFTAQTGRRPDPSEVTAAMKSNPAVLIPPTTHAETDTYKNKNTKDQIKKDSENLDEAARRGISDVIEAAKKTNEHLPAESARKLQEMQEQGKKK